MFGSIRGGIGGAFPVRCNRGKSGSRFAAHPSSRDGKPVRFGERRGRVPESVLIPKNDPPIERPTMPRFPCQALQHSCCCRAPLGAQL